ncbi:TPA: hypothetical protein WIC56_000018 [Neisseria meningitidis]|uniref:hypothetical protein n=1 Tax=Neisseria meningitidis TaxID=487 RepID=UPI00027C90ED|nr:hypothetical protein [Neisseria meningitidis]EJU78370.1 hypothetical protein NMEN3081_1574 [Neisseria meningitidis NM3081]
MKEMKKPARSGQEKSGIIEISISELRYLMKYAAIATNASDEVRKGLIDEVQEWAISRLGTKRQKGIQPLESLSHLFVFIKIKRLVQKKIPSFVRLNQRRDG